MILSNQSERLIQTVADLELVSIDDAVYILFGRYCEISFYESLEYDLLS